MKMAVVLALVLLAATSRVLGRFYQSKRVDASDGDLLIVTGQVEIGILSGFSSTLRYLNGTCSWRVTVNVAGNEIDQEVDVGLQITVDGGGGGSDSFTLKCVTEDGEQLNAIISTHGEGDNLLISHMCTDDCIKSHISSFFLAQETIPPPSSITLDYETGILHWRHPFHPELPLDFEIIHEHSVSYSVTVVHSESGESEETMMSPVTTLSISHVLDNCSRQEFTVQTVVNDQYFSELESFVHDPDSKLAA